MDVIYRLSDNGYHKPKFPNATKQHCLSNAIKEFGLDNMHMFVDMTNLNTETSDFVKQQGSFKNLEYYVGGSSAGSWRHVFDYALQTFTDPTDVVYFLEDDYLHLPNSANIMKEGIDRADYVSLYDHNDTYIPASAGGNVFVDDSGASRFPTLIFRTESSHWRTVSSTTMTFATTISQLHKDKLIWEKHTLGSHPNDFQCFMELNRLGRSLITPIPGYSTHCEPRWASPGINWEII